MKKDRHIKLKTAILASVCLVMAFSHVRQVYAQDIDACLACHQDRNLTKNDASGKVHSLFVDKEPFLKSTHAGLSCVDCHEGVQAKKHPAGGIKDVDCGGCHEDEAKKYGASSWGMAGACIGGTLGLMTANIIGLIAGSFAGAVVFELLKGGELKASVKVGYGTLVGFLCGAVGKVIIAFIMVGYFILQVWR